MQDFEFVVTHEAEYTIADEMNDVVEALERIGNQPLAAFDFETAPRLLPKTQERAIARAEAVLPHNRELSRILNQLGTATGLSHPRLTRTTHLGCYYGADTADIFIIHKNKLRDTVLDFLISTDMLQLWHNASFDFKYIYHYTKQFPKHFIDTQLAAKCNLNNADNSKCEVGLKKLMGYKYGNWANAKDDTGFILSNVYSPKMLNYLAIDVKATYDLYNLLPNKEMLEY